MCSIAGRRIPLCLREVGCGGPAKIFLSAGAAALRLQYFSDPRIHRSARAPRHLLVDIWHE